MAKENSLKKIVFKKIMNKIESKEEKKIIGRSNQSIPFSLK